MQQFTLHHLSIGKTQFFYLLKIGSYTQKFGFFLTLDFHILGVYQCQKNMQEELLKFCDKMHKLCRNGFLSKVCTHYYQRPAGAGIMLLPSALFCTLFLGIQCLIALQFFYELTPLTQITRFTTFSFKQDARI